MKHFEGVDPKEIAFIGDRILTDILFANCNGFYPILVDPINPGLEKLEVKFIRKLERLLLSKGQLQDNFFKNFPI